MPGRATLSPMSIAFSVLTLFPGRDFALLFLLRNSGVKGFQKSVCVRGHEIDCHVYHPLPTPPRIDASAFSLRRTVNTACISAFAPLVVTVVVSNGKLSRYAELHGG